MDFIGANITDDKPLQYLYILIVLELLLFSVFFLIIISIGIDVILYSFYMS